ncbi:unnamed protein product [Protopolystoma xenopodis]|uniref:Guanylate kinase-like domain-containing protein n=1 Tax=Protopolystoma xenopodis TaxID=117903 RepID=A0A448XND8_9PLAT|nr:unnamed protein product [Protopolystoma xenopodis]
MSATGRFQAGQAGGPRSGSVDTLHDRASVGDLSSLAPLVRSYEKVMPVRLPMECLARPLVLFGPLKERITEALLAREDKQFVCCVPRKLPASVL